ncbi:MAG TPA: CRISPR-associated protein Cas4 [Caldilineaceae bacterium]|nr:CRISPR-associated protein Cas4 [Caldilineaceae bacterium]
MEEQEQWLLRVTDLKQYDYCPRVVYYQYCLPKLRPLTYKMTAGIAAQEQVTALEERRSLRTYGLTTGERHFNVTVSSARLGYTGQIDMLIETMQHDQRTLIPIDFKLTRHEGGHHFQIQVAAYALLLEDQWDVPVAQGMLYLIPTKQVVKVAITPTVRRSAQRHLSEMRQMIERQVTPPPTRQRSRCINCEFRRFCNDVL